MLKLIICSVICTCACSLSVKAQQSPGVAYEDSCKAALQPLTRGDNYYQGSGWSDGRAAAEDAHYHEDPTRYDGSQDGRPYR